MARVQELSWKMAAWGIKPNRPTLGLTLRDHDQMLKQVSLFSLVVPFHPPSLPVSAVDLEVLYALKHLGIFKKCSRKAT